MATLERPTRIKTVTFVVNGASRTMIEPLSSRTSPAQTLKLMNRPVTTSEESSTTTSPPPATVAVWLETTSGRFVVTLASSRVLVVLAGAQTLRELMNKLVVGVSASTVTVLVVSLVM